MSVSDNLEFPLLTEQALQKTIAINLALSMMEKAITETLVVSTALATSSGYDIVLPYSNANDLSTRAALHCIAIELEAGATQNFDVIHPQNPHLFIVTNNTSRTARFMTAALGAANHTVPAGARQLLYCDGTNIMVNNFTLSQLTSPYDCEFAYWGQPPESVVMGRILVPRDAVFPANFAGSRGRVTTPPLINHVLQVWDDATQIGTVTIEPDGDFVFATTGGTAKTVNADSLLELRNSAVLDPLMDQIQLVLLGTVTVAQ